MSSGVVVRRTMRRRRLVACSLAAFAFAVPIAAQVDSTLAQEGIYDRPFIASVSNTAIGGYVEGNTNYFIEDGITEGFSMELRRFNIFMYSSISQRVRFLSELEFEHGTEEIALETALVDFQVSPALVLRAGIILPPIGYLNQNHDSNTNYFIEDGITEGAWSCGASTSSCIPRSLSVCAF